MVSARDLRVAATVDTPRGVPKAGGKSNVGGDAGARAPNVVSARVTTKATVLLRRPAIILISCRCATADGQFTPETWRKVPPTGRSKKTAWPFQRLGGCSSLSHSLRTNTLLVALTPVPDLFLVAYRYAANTPPTYPAMTGFFGGTRFPAGVPGSSGEAPARGYPNGRMGGLPRSAAGHPNHGGASTLASVQGSACAAA